MTDKKSQEYNVTKVNNESPAASPRSTSSGNINIGLDLLMNKEKTRPDNSSQDEGFDLNEISDRKLEELIDKKDLYDKDLRSHEQLLDKISRRTKSTANRSRSTRSKSTKNTISSRNSIRSKTSGISLEGDQYPHIVRNNSDIQSMERPLNNSFKPPTNIEKENNEKEDLILKLEKMKRQGINCKTFSLSSKIDDIRLEYNRVKSDRESEISVKFQKKMLMACITGIEFLNNKFDPFELKLDGWSESIHENINDYNEVFEELHEKYKDKGKMSPELKLLFMVGGSGMMFHLTNTMFKSTMPAMGDIMKQNPDLMKQFTSAAMNSVGGEGMASLFAQSSSGPSSVNNVNNNIDVNIPSKIQEPTGVDDILKELNMGS